MKYKILGDSGLKVSAQGLGCMGMSEFYGTPDQEEVIRTLHEAYRAGINFFDTADLYGYGENEVLLRDVLLASYPRDTLIIATKGGILRDKHDSTKRGIDNSPTYMRAACERSLARLGVDYVDLYYVHRIANHGNEIEKTMLELSKLVSEGKIRYIGLSEASPQMIRRAHAIHPITTIQTEYSLWRRNPEIDGVLEVCRELNIAFVPYSPLGRGFLTGAINNPEVQLEEGDFRKTLPRFKDDNFKHNLTIVEGLKKMAIEKACTPAQLSLAWIIAKGEEIIPIPGTKKTKNLHDNLGALDVDLTETDMEKLDSIAPIGVAKGTRYTPASMAAYGFEDDLTSAVSRNGK